jgi:hypothetical protein
MAEAKQNKLNALKDLIDNARLLKDNSQFDSWIDESVVSLKRNFPDEKQLIKQFKNYRDSYTNDFDQEDTTVWSYEKDRTSLIKLLEGLMIHVHEQKEEKVEDSKTKTERYIDYLNHLIQDLEVIEDGKAFSQWKGRTTDFIKKIADKNSTFYAIAKMRIAYEMTDLENDHLKHIKVDAIKLLKGEIKALELIGVDSIESNSAPANVFNLTQTQSNNQTQSNHQETNINLEINNILEHFKDSLTGGEIKAIKEVQESNEESKEKKRKIGEILGDKALDLGVALASTPEVWHWIMERFK